MEVGAEWRLGRNGGLGGMHLTGTELEVMQAVWRLGETTAPDVHEAVRSDRLVSYSTVKTMLDRLEKKGAVRRVRQEGRTIVIDAAVAPEAVEASMLDRLVNGLFGGDRRPMFTRLLRDEALTADDLEFLERLIQERKEANEP